MSLETSTTQSDVKGSSISLPFPKEGWVRFMYGVFITVLPAFSFLAVQFLKPDWQSGSLSAYLALFLQPEASMLFLFLLACSIACCVLLLINLDHYSSMFMLRFGIYIGALLALQYSFILLFYVLDQLFSPAILLLWLFPLYFPKIYWWAVSKWAAGRVHSGLTILVMIAVVIAIVIYRDPFLLLFISFAAFVTSAPFWSFLMVGQAAIWLYKNCETKLILPHGLGLTAWLAAYIAALQFDILKMYELYAALPSQPPYDCYIATAAARGHPHFVRSQTVQRADGKSMQVNRQLQILKCAELALLAINPRLHAILRRIYDMVGKSLARRIQNPFLADVAYLLLQPWEWGAVFVLKLIIPEIGSISRRIYIEG